jgi:hypothetical protein
MHTCGRSGLPKIKQALSTLNCTQRTPAGLPLGMPGMGDEMDGAMQHAPQPKRHDNIKLACSNTGSITNVHRIYKTADGLGNTAIWATITTEFGRATMQALSADEHHIKITAVVMTA